MNSQKVCQSVSLFSEADSQKTDASDMEAPGGLPNIGNTCFLNSVLQQLYQIQVVNNFILSYDKKDNSFMKYLKKLFRLMRRQDCQYEKRDILKHLVNNMKQILPNYIPYQQYDSFQTLTSILVLLFSLNERLKQNFYVRFSQKCQCKHGIISKFYQFTIQNHKQMTCSDCKAPIKRLYQSFPDYLIVNFMKGEKERLQIDELKQKNLQYKLQSKNIYIGNGKVGHYISECIYKKQSYVFDDQFFTKKIDNQNRCLFAVYKKVFINEDDGDVTSIFPPRYQIGIQLGIYNRINASQQSIKEAFMRFKRQEYYLKNGIPSSENKRTLEHNSRIFKWHNFKEKDTNLNKNSSKPTVPNKDNQKVAAQKHQSPFLNGIFFLEQMASKLFSYNVEKENLSQFTFDRLSYFNPILN